MERVQEEEVRAAKTTPCGRRFPKASKIWDGDNATNHFSYVNELFQMPQRIVSNWKVTRASY